MDTSEQLWERVRELKLAAMEVLALVSEKRLPPLEALRVGNVLNQKAHELEQLARGGSHAQASTRDPTRHH